jgi:hypothetical protein
MRWSRQWTNAPARRRRLGRALGLLLHAAALSLLATGCAYPYYSYPYWYFPNPTNSPPAVVVEPPMTSEPPPVQREVVYSHGKYVLRGDGVSQPWDWVWVPAPSAQPPPSAPR